MAILYAVTLFVSAFLLFLVQPIVGKMLLPTLGGTPLAWNTCMVFFQILLLGGYLYSHLTTKWFGVHKQSRWHLVLLGLTLLVLAVVAGIYKQPVAIDKDLTPQGQDLPIFGILLVLFLAVGVPFFAIATSAPLLQRWFSQSGHSAAKDPYFLYAASNVGSVLALVVYPLWVEPSLRLATQSWLWAGGCGVLAVLVGLCAITLPKPVSTPPNLRSGGTANPKPATPAVVVAPAEEPVTWPKRLRWLALAIVPSSLMLGVTTYLVTDIASIPLLWLMPLGIYLISFIVAFLRLPKFMYWVFTLSMPVFVLLLLFVKYTYAVESMSWLFVLHLAVFASVALTCHSDLARTRPSTSHLTEFYLIMSIGGVLGGLINTLFAPLIFNDVYEYELALVGACLLLPALFAPKAKPLAIVLDLGFPLAVLGLALYLTNQTRSLPDQPKLWDRFRYTLMPVAEFLTKILNKVGSSKQPLDVRAGDLFQWLKYGIPLSATLLAVHRPWRFGLAVAAVAIAAYFAVDRTDVVLKDRSPFGILRVEESESVDNDTGEAALVYTLSHGTTTHGDQQVFPESLMPRTYYHPDGPIGDVFLREYYGPRTRKNMAFIGLGTGTLAAYGRKGQQITYYEIDPVVRRIATDSRYFSYVTECDAAVEIVLGDARIQMERRKDARYDLIIVDAFSSDAIPVHLITREAIQLYLSRLAPDGSIILHISNRHLDLGRVAARHARDLDLQALHIDDGGGDDNTYYSSEWVLIAPRQTKLTYLSKQEQYWNPIEQFDSDPVWTDDFSSILPVLKEDFAWIRRYARGK